MVGWGGWGFEFVRESRMDGAALLIRSTMLWVIREQSKKREVQHARADR